MPDEGGYLLPESNGPKFEGNAKKVPVFATVVVSFGLLAFPRTIVVCRKLLWGSVEMLTKERSEWVGNPTQSLYKYCLL